jgi:diaminopimelate decarboxylase
MDHFIYREGQLYCEDVPVHQIADAVGTPAYVYSAATLTDHFRRLAEAFADLNPVVCYSVKSCQNTHICRLLADQGAGFDVVSGGELFRVKQAGGDMRKVVFAGVGKTDVEIRDALSANIAVFKFVFYV